MCQLTKAQKQIIISALLTEIHDLRVTVAILKPVDLVYPAAIDALKKRRDIVKLLSKREGSLCITS